MRKNSASRIARPLDRRRAAAATTLVRSEGQRLLLLQAGSLAEIAAACRCKSRQNVNDWRHGAKVPDPASRAQLWGAFQIPAIAWSQPPVELAPPPVAGNVPPPPPAPPPPDPAASAGPPPTTLDACLQLLVKIRAESERVLLPSERVKLADTEARILTLRHKLESEAALKEDRIIREHPRWIAVKRTILEALDGHPAASKAVCDALTRLGGV